jgi:signal transduction histidine kinase
MIDLAPLEHDFRTGIDEIFGRTQAIPVAGPMTDLQYNDLVLIDQNAHYILDIFNNPADHSAIREEYGGFVGELSQMGHEFRTPLNAIIGFSTTMLEYPAIYQAKVTDEQAEHLSAIQQIGWELLSILHEYMLNIQR